MKEEHPSPDTSFDLQGQLLLADPSLHDGTFDRSVILLAEHSHEKGAFGLILNHPTGRTVGDFLTEEAFAPLRHIDVHLGGPVSREHLTFSALWWKPGKGLSWETSIPAEKAIEHLHRPGTLVRAFIGYSGWSAGQLETEMRRHSWIAVHPDTSMLGKVHDASLWKGILSDLSPYHRILAETPDHPFLN